MANLEGMPISSLPETSFQNSDQVIGYRSETGKAYRASVGSLGEAAEENISDAFDESKEYSAGDYCIYNDTLYKFTADKTAGAWDESVVEKTNVGTEISQNASDISELNTALTALTNPITFASAFDLMPDGATGTEIQNYHHYCYFNSGSLQSQYHLPVETGGFALVLGNSTARYVILYITRDSNRMFIRSDGSDWTEIS